MPESKVGPLAMGLEGLICSNCAHTAVEVFDGESREQHNPVRHDYNGPLTVQGLKANSLCKITDASGKLVWQGYSNGGELVWYCKDLFGQRPETGVYYVMCSDENGKEKAVTKFLFIR